MALPKLFERIFWHNNTTPAINEDNLNAMSKAIDDIDDRVITLGDDVITVIPQIQAYLSQAEDLVETMEQLSENPPYIGANGNWYVWDTQTSDFVDSGVDASITVDIADITMLAPSETPYVTNTGTNTDPIFHLFIPRGQTGTGITSIVKTASVGNVDTYTITFSDGNTTTFDVTNGSGSGDMRTSVYDSDNAVANAGGIKDFALSQSAFSEMGAKNLLPNYFQTATVYSTINLTAYADGRFKIDGTIANDTNVNILYSWNYPTSAFKQFVGKKVKFSWGNSDFGTYLGIILSDASGNPVLSINTENGEGIITAEPTAITIYAHLLSGVTYNHILYPMLTLASITEPTFEPYALTNQQLTPYALSQSNPNLLDNPWFTVNQRGATAVTTTWTHFVDRWRTGNNAYNLVINNDKTITFKSGGKTEINQAIEYDRFNLGKTYTLSVLMGDGTIRSVSGVISQKSQWTRLFLVRLDSTDDFVASVDADQYNVSVGIFSGANLTADHTIKAVKLELGTQSTLSHDTAPNYAEELLKCQRYFYRVHDLKFIAVCSRDARPCMAVNFPIEMRAIPSLAGALFGANCIIVCEGVFGEITAIDAYEFFKDSAKLFLTTTLSNAAVGKVCDAELNSTTPCYIDFSADL